MLAFGHDFHAAVVTVSHPPGQVTLHGGLHDEIAEADPLDAAADVGMQPKQRRLTHCQPSGRSILVPVVFVVIIIIKVIIEVVIFVVPVIFILVAVVIVKNHHVEHIGLFGEVEIFQGLFQE